MARIKLRDINRRNNNLHEIGCLPINLLQSICGGLVHNIYVGRTDLEGRTWGDIFADAVNGTHLDSPLGIVDVVSDEIGWSMKTIKSSNKIVFNSKNINLILGRNDVNGSFNYSDFEKDIQYTGNLVLRIWNARVDIAKERCRHSRSATLLRSKDLLSYVYFENDIEHFRESDYYWKINKNGNFEGFNVDTNKKTFTWQPGGAQFTIHTKIPTDAIKFRIKAPDMVLKKDEVLQEIGFDESWFEVVSGKIEK